MKIFKKTSSRFPSIKTMLLGFVAFVGAASPAYSQGTIAGKLTLPFEVRWGNKVLSAGNYNYSIESVGSSIQTVTSITSGYYPVLVVVRSARGGPANLILALATTQSARSATTSGLSIETTPSGPTVRTMCLENFGIILEFQAIRAKAVMYAKEPQASQQPTTSKDGH